MRGIDPNESAEFAREEFQPGAMNEGAHGVSDEEAGKVYLCGEQKVAQLDGELFCGSRSAAGLAPTESGAIVGEHVGEGGEFGSEPTPAGRHHGQASFEDEPRLGRVVVVLSEMDFCFRELD